MCLGYTLETVENPHILEPRAKRMSCKSSSEAVLLKFFIHTYVPLCPCDVIIYIFFLKGRNPPRQQLIGGIFLCLVVEIPYHSLFSSVVFFFARAKRGAERLAA